MPTSFWVQLGLFILKWWLSQQKDDSEIIKLLGEAKTKDDLLRLVEDPETVKKLSE